MMTITVPPQMPSRTPTRLAFVAEAPSDDELISKVPLTGPSGRVFNAMLRSANIDRDDVYIGNVFNEKAPDNDVSGWMKDEARVADNLARLNEELSAVEPTVIIPLGGTALWAFLGERANISHYRGAVTAAKQIRPGAKLVPTFHPAAVMRNWSMLPIVVGDLIKADTEADFPDIRYPKVQLLIEPTLEDVERFAGLCKATDKLSVDIETGWGQIRSIAFAPSTEIAMSIPFIDLRKPNKSYWPTLDEEVAVWLMVKDILETDVPKVGQNYMYDIYWLWQQKGIATRNYRYDTRLRHKVLYPELPADLASMTASYTRIGAYKMWGGRYQKETKKDG